MVGAVGQQWSYDVGLTPSLCCRDLLRVLSEEELCLLERSLCTAESEEPCGPAAPPAWGAAVPRADSPAPWSLLEVSRATLPPPSCMVWLGPPSAVDDLGTHRQWGCVVGREQGWTGRSLPAGMRTLCHPCGNCHLLPVQPPTPWEQPRA